MPKTRYSFVASLAGVLFMLLVLGCGSEHSVEDRAVTATVAGEEKTMSLENTNWVLIELNGDTVSVTESMKVPSIRFDREEGQVSGNNGVNSFSGGYTLTDDSIEFGPMRSTLMAGPPEAMELEAAFMRALGGMTGWRIHEGRFELLNGEEVTAVFVTAPSPARAVVTGTVYYRERIMLVPGSVLEVVLEDVSLADAPAVQIAAYRKEDPGSPPFAFELPFDPATIDERHTYGARARITVDGRLRFISDTAHHVITRDNGNQVEILVKGVPSGESGG